MAQGDGQVALGDYYLNLDNEETSGGSMYYYFLLRLPRMPQAWNDDDLDNKMCRLQYTVELINESSDTDCKIYLKWKAGNVGDTTDAEYYDIGTLAWQSAEEDTEYPGCQFYWPDDVNALGWVLVEMEVYNGDLDVGEDRHVTFIGLEAIHDQGQPSGGAMKIQRGTAAERLYIPDLPCSAFHMQSVLADTLKHILYENRPAFCVPIAGEPDEILD